MSRLDSLPPDQQAALELLLRQRKSYAEVAVLLGIQERSLHDRAHAALAMLAPRQARELSAERREEIGDYLLGQNGVADRLATHTFLDGSAPGRAWASAISTELAPLAATPLPEIPGGTAPPGSFAADGIRDEPLAAPTSTASFAGGRSPSSLQGSRLGGALLLAALLAGVIVAVILIAGGGSSSHSASTAAAATGAGSASSSTSTTATKASGPKEDKRLSLTSPDPTSKAIGVVEILSEGGKRAFYMAAEHLAPSKGFFYGIWLYNSAGSHEALSKSPPVSSNGRLQGGALLPANAGEYHQLLITRETSERPSQPGPIVLSGPFSLH